jgi:hypothetical protein
VALAQLLGLLLLAARLCRRAGIDRWIGRFSDRWLRRGSRRPGVRCWRLG